ncbi:MAG: hypothetical protein NUV47_01395 [Patescibacteria group bacterium]|nr:hypothetical protein [Patescibacteria group bacterium]
MLSAFPTLLNYSMIAPFLIRLTLAGVFLVMAKSNVMSGGHKKTIGTIQIIGSLFLIIGLFTQVVALVFGIYLVYLIQQKIKTHAFLTKGINYYLILFILCVVLLISGAGRFAIDIPL